MPYEEIEKPQLEHIAPQTPTKGEPIAAGYCEYDDEFKEKYLDCLGNYLLLSASHNCSIGNVPFADKRETQLHHCEKHRKAVRASRKGHRQGQLLDCRRGAFLRAYRQNIL